MGRADTPILISGEETVYREYESLLRMFGGGLTWLGNDASAANALDLATLSALYGAIVGFFQGARVAEAEGFDVARYGEIVNGIMPTFGEFLQHAREKQIHTSFPALMAKLLKDAHSAGYADEELAAVIKVLRHKN